MTSGIYTGPVDTHRQLSVMIYELLTELSFIQHTINIHLLPYFDFHKFEQTWKG